MATTNTKTAGQLPRGRHNLAPEAVADSQRQRIMQGMVDVVAERGFADARIADVIETAGVSRKTYYELFEDKEACFLATYELWAGRMLAVTAEAFESEPDAPWPDRLRSGLGALLEFVADHPAAARCCIVEVMAAGPKALNRRDAAIRQFTDFLDLGRTESTVALPGITSLALAGGVNELLYSEILHGATAQLPSRLADLMYWLVQPYLGDERAAIERKRTRGSDEETASRAS